MEKDIQEETQIAIADYLTKPNNPQLESYIIVIENAQEYYLTKDYKHKKVTLKGENRIPVSRSLRNEDMNIVKLFENLLTKLQQSPKYE